MRICCHWNGYLQHARRQGLGDALVSLLGLAEGGHASRSSSVRRPLPAAHTLLCKPAERARRHENRHENTRRGTGTRHEQQRRRRAAAAAAAAHSSAMAECMQSERRLRSLETNTTRCSDSSAAKSASTPGTQRCLHRGAGAEKPASPPLASTSPRRAFPRARALGVWRSQTRHVRFASLAKTRARGAYCHRACCSSGDAPEQRREVLGAGERRGVVVRALQREALPALRRQKRQAWTVTTRILGRRTAPIAPFLIPHPRPTWFCGINGSRVDTEDAAVVVV